MRRHAFLRSAGAAAILPATLGTTTAGSGFLPQSTIAVNVPLSGPLAGYGREIVKGVQACIDETNRYTATLSRAWGLRALDDQNSGAVASSNVFVAASDPSVVGTIGDITASVALDALPNYANAGFAVVFPTITADVLTARGYRNVFRLPTKDSTEGQLFARVALRDRGNPAIAVLQGTDAYAASVAQGFIAQAKADKRTATLVMMEAHADPKNVAGRVMEAKPDYVFLAGRSQELGPVVEALAKQSYKGAYGACDAFFTTAILDPYGKVLDGALVGTSAPPIERIPTIVSLLRDFQGEVGDVTAFSAYGYAAAQLLIAASGRANAKDRFSLLTQLQQGGTYNLLIGQYSFAYTGDAILPNLYFFRVSEKGFTYDRSAVPNGFVV